MSWVIENGDCRAVLQGCAAESFDAMVTDPPSGTAFMNREWDGDKGGRDAWIVWLRDVMAEAMRCLKPGAHALVWALPRTSHWTATALEDAGFEVREIIHHHHGSGFPKSVDLSKAMDKMAGAEREVVGSQKFRDIRNGHGRTYGAGIDAGQREAPEYLQHPITSPTTDEAKAWGGYGSALKPATEHWLLCRKPLGESSIARNVLKYGVGGLNIDGCRVAGAPEATRFNPGKHSHDGWRMTASGAETANTAASKAGRFPPNVLFSHSEGCGQECAADCPVAELDRQSGATQSRRGKPRRSQEPGDGYGMVHTGAEYEDRGGASRFFPTFRYQAKPARGEKEQGLGDLPERTLNRVNPGGLEHEPRWGPVAVKNNHPTVKGISLCRWLVRLISPPGGGVVLDPFCGSGSIGCAALLEGCGFFGIEQEADYCAIAAARLKHWETTS